VNCLVYLVIKSLKNRIMELPRKPAKLVLYILGAVSIPVLVLFSQHTRQMMETPYDIIWLKGAFFLFLLMDLFAVLERGLSTGNTIFEMSDVNLLFVSPVNPRAVLAYGLARMINMAFFAGFFILFQGVSLSLWFGLSFSAVLPLLLGAFLAVLCLIILSLVIYSFSNSRPRRKRLVRLIALAAFLPLALYGVRQYLQTGDMTQALARVLNSPVLAWTPVAGWAAEGSIALIQGGLGRGLFFLALPLLGSALLVLAVILSKPDYYEDVLVAAEGTFEKKRAIADGQLAAAMTTAAQTRVSKTGIAGSGAAVFFFKHLRESFRANPLGLWGLPSLLLVAGTALGAFFFRHDETGPLALMPALLWIQIFRAGMGRGMQELYSPVLYLIPAAPFSKILWISLEQVFKTLVEAAAMFAAAGIIMGVSPWIAAEEALVYTLSCPLLIGINILSLRWTGTSLSAGIMLLLYGLTAMLFMLPGLIGAAFAYVFWGLPAALGVFAAWETLAALGCFALSRGILHRCDMPVVRAPG
jgi:hypothetical protein